MENVDNFLNWMPTNAELFALSHKKPTTCDVIVAVPWVVYIYCDVSSDWVLSPKMVIAIYLYPRFNSRTLLYIYYIYYI